MVDRMRLRCRAHNQYEAERAFGVGFMNRKRHEARCAAEARARALAKGRAANEQAVREQAASEQVQDVLAGLRNLGCRADEARRAAAFTGTLNNATLEERMRAALKFLSRTPIRTALEIPEQSYRGTHQGRARDDEREINGSRARPEPFAHNAEGGNVHDGDREHHRGRGTESHPLRE